MGIFLAYTLKTAICLLLFFIFNKLILSKDTFHTLNRVVWLLVAGFSLILPMFEWGWMNVETAIIENYNNVPMTTFNPELFTIVEQVDDYNIDLIVKYSLIIYVLFATFFGIKLLVSYFKLLAFIIKNSSDNIDSEKHIALLEKCKSIIGYNKKIRFIVHTKQTSPFSWMNYIVVSKQDIEDNGKDIIIHELAHIKQRHSLDLIIADLLIIFQWFNPAAWLYKRSLQQVHEYMADEAVLKTGVNAKEYQLLLIKKAVGQRLYTMANSFNHSNLKNRITMMLKEKSNKWAAAKCLYALPLALFAVTAFANPLISDHFDEISSVKITKNSEINDVLEENNLLYEDDKAEEIVFVTVVEDGEAKDGAVLTTTKPTRDTTKIAKKMYVIEEDGTVIHA